jgi:hypothetical protein
MKDSRSLDSQRNDQGGRGGRGKEIAAAALLSLASLPACTSNIHVNEARLRPDGSIGIISPSEEGLHDVVKLTADVVIDADGQRWKFYSKDGSQAVPVVLETALTGVLGQPSSFRRFDGLEGVYKLVTSEPE